MNKTILAVAAILLASGTAFANERQGDAAPAVVVNQDAVAASTAASVPLPRQGDAVPASSVVHAPSSANYGSSASIGAYAGRQVGNSPRLLDRGN